jgi:hypothetical protein
MRWMLAIFMAVSAQLAALEPFPLLEAKDLHGQVQSLPVAVSGTPCVLVFGFTNDSKQNTQAWDKALANAVAEPHFFVLAVPVVEGAPGFVMPLILRALKKRFSQERWRQVLPVKKDRAVWEKLMGFEKGPAEDDAYLLLIDQKGMMRWKGHGPHSEALESELKKVLTSMKGR